MKHLLIGLALGIILALSNGCASTSPKPFVEVNLYCDTDTDCMNKFGGNGDPAPCYGVYFDSNELITKQAYDKATGAK